MKTLTRDPIENIKFLMSDTIDWKGTIGVGDFMMGLNTCHMISHLMNKPVKMNVHWNHDSKYLFHCEDPETIVERMEWIHSRYHRQHDVEVTHVFNSEDKDVFQYRWRGFDRFDRKRGTAIAGINSWAFRPDLFTEIDDNKVVIWKPFKNATPAPSWKKSFTEQDWSLIHGWYLTEKHKYNVVELDYRTPVREAFYHLSNCKFFVCYDGMWHYIARNFLKPGVVVGNNGIIKYHNPQCILYEKPDEYKSLFKHRDVLEQKLEEQCKPYREKVLKLIEQ